MKALWLCMLVALLSGLNPIAAHALETETWGRLLSRHVSAGRVNYAALHKDQDARSALAAFLRGAARMREDEPLATWLNVYNALVVTSIIDRYPIHSVRDVSGFFDAQRHRVAGRQRTLDEIEQQVILERFKDSRVHAALCYGARSSPPLPSEPFQTDTLDATLTKLSQAWVNNEAYVKHVDNRLALTSLFYWFNDFARDAGSLVGWIRKYGGPRYAALRDDVALIEINYDWTLNTK